jgi:hypothetical protein
MTDTTKIMRLLRDYREHEDDSSFRELVLALAEHALAVKPPKPCPACGGLGRDPVIGLNCFVCDETGLANVREVL